MGAAGVAAAPEFFFTPSCPYYSYPLGALSPLGDDEAALLTFAAEHDVEGDALAQVCVCGGGGAGGNVPVAGGGGALRAPGGPPNNPLACRTRRHAA